MRLLRKNTRRHKAKTPGRISPSNSRNIQTIEHKDSEWILLFFLHVPEEKTLLKKHWNETSSIKKVFFKVCPCKGAATCWRRCAEYIPASHSFTSVLKENHFIFQEQRPVRVGDAHPSGSRKSFEWLFQDIASTSNEREGVKIGKVQSLKKNWMRGRSTTVVKIF